MFIFIMFIRSALSLFLFSYRAQENINIIIDFYDAHVNAHTRDTIYAFVRAQKIISYNYDLLAHLISHSHKFIYLV